MIDFTVSQNFGSPQPDQLSMLTVNNCECSADC